MATTNFNTTNSTFRQLLANGLTYRVPPFQRDYSWTDDEWDDLWQDFEGLFEDDGESAHYMGYLVLQSSDTKNFDIIDGQQRITTISLVILAGLAILQDLANADLEAESNLRRKEQLQNSYIGYLDPVSLIAQSKLKLNRHNDRFYQTYLAPLQPMPQRGLNLSEHQLRKSFNWFKEKFKSKFGMQIESGKKLTKFIDSLVDKLFFTVITVTDELNAFKVFETLNARGVRLSATDLLKNYLFSVISSADSHENEIRNLEDRWERIVGLLGSESFPEFLRVYWNSHNRLVRKSDLFKTIRRSITTREKAHELVRNLDYSAATYAALRDHQDQMWESKEQQALGHLKMFNVRQPLAILMAAHKQFFKTDRKTFARVLRAIEVISFRYNVICNMQTHHQERLYNEVARKISDGSHQNFQDIITSLSDVYPEDEQFKSAFAEKELQTTNSRNKKVARYILFELEKHFSGQAFEFENAAYSLEHILPESPSEQWAYIAEAKQDRLIYRLGNMTPLETTPNRDIGNSGYEQKRSVYQQCKFDITKDISEKYDTWDENKIVERQKQLAKSATSIWRIEFKK